MAKFRYEEMRKEHDPRKYPPNFMITKVVRKMELVSFNLNDPESLAQFADSDADEEELSVASTSTSILDEQDDGQEDGESTRSSVQFDRCAQFHFLQKEILLFYSNITLYQVLKNQNNCYIYFSAHLETELDATFILEDKKLKLVE